jgi:hypothetical protein
LSNVVRVIATVSEEAAGLGQVVGHDRIEAQAVRCLARRDLGSHGQARAIDAEVDLGREVEGGSENSPVDRFPD